MNKNAGHQCTVLQVEENYGNTLITVPFTSDFTVHPRFDTQQLLPIRRSQKFVCRKHFGSNREVIAETKVYFAAKDMEML